MKDKIKRVLNLITLVVAMIVITGCGNGKKTDDSQTTDNKKASSITFVVDPKLDFWTVSYFSDGLACVEKERDRWGYIDKNGNTVIPFSYGYADSFSEGLAFVQEDRNSLGGYIDRKGEMVFSTKFNEFSGRFSEGLAAVDQFEDTCGYIDKTGKCVITLPNCSLGEFSEGFAIVTENVSPEQQDLYLIDKTGKTVISSLRLGKGYGEVWDFSEGLALVYNGKFSFIDHTGKSVLPWYDSAMSFKEGLAYVLTDDGNWAFINKEGEVVITLDDELSPPATDYQGFSEGLALVMKEDDDIRSYGYIDKSGELVIPCEYELAMDFNEGIACVQKDNRWGYINRKGEVILPIEYDNVRSFSEGLAFVKKEDLYGIVQVHYD